MRPADAPGLRINFWRWVSVRAGHQGAHFLLDDPRELPGDLRPHLRRHELEAELRPRLRELHERVRLAHLRLQKVLHGLADLRAQLRVRVEPHAHVRLDLVLHEVAQRLDEQVLRVNRADRVPQHLLDDVFLRHANHTARRAHEPLDVDTVTLRADGGIRATDEPPDGPRRVQGPAEALVRLRPGRPPAPRTPVAAAPVPLPPAPRSEEHTSEL